MAKALSIISLVFTMFAALANEMSLKVVSLMIALIAVLANGVCYYKKSREEKVQEEVLRLLEGMLEGGNCPDTEIRAGSSVQPMASHSEEEQAEILEIIREAEGEGVNLTREVMRELIDGYRKGMRTWAEINGMRGKNE